MAESERYVDEIPRPRLIKVKKNRPPSDADLVQCHLCPKSFASGVALRNHARMEHADAYDMNGADVWGYDNTVDIKLEADPLNFNSNKSMIIELEPTSVALASNDVSYVIVKAEDDMIMGRKKLQRAAKKSREDVKEPVKVVPKKKKEALPITGPFECLQPSVLVQDGICHQIFFSCCEYSIHYRDDHAKRKKVLTCQVCEKSLACAGEEQPAPFLCKVCGLGFQTSEELTGHSTIAHIKLKPFECTICHKWFTQQGGVAQHARMHTGDRPYPCSFCPKAFTQKSGLDQHLRIHTKVKPYRCVVCNKTFCQSVHLRQHMRTHTNVAPFQCVICDKRFKQSNHLNTHLKIHNSGTMSEEQKAKYAELMNVINMTEIPVETQLGAVVNEGES